MIYVTAGVRYGVFYTVNFINQHWSNKNVHIVEEQFTLHRFK